MQNPKSQLLIILLLLQFFAWAQNNYPEIDSLIDNNQLASAQLRIRSTFYPDTNSFDYYYLNGRVERKRGNYEKAQLNFEKCIQIKPGSVKPYGNLADLNTRKKKYNKALEYCDRALEIDPQNADILNEKAIIYYDLRDYKSAVYYLKRILTVNPDDPDILYNVGTTLNQLRKYEEAISYFDKAAVIRPEDTKVYHDRGIAHYLLGDPIAAVNDLELSLKYRDLCKDDYLRPKKKVTQKYLSAAYHDVKDLYPSVYKKMKDEKRRDN